jgi:Papain family cysteine protease
MASVEHFFQGRVKDQGERPTCVAFAVSAFHEHWIEIRTMGKSQIDLDLSEEFLFYGCKQRDGLSISADGTTVRAASDCLLTNGQCIEHLHPYQSRGRLLLTPSQTAISDANRHTLDRLVPKAVTFDVLSASLAKGIPVVGVIEIFQTAYLPGTDGKLPIPELGERRLGLHAILFIDALGEPTIRTTTFLNSWGASWGDNGFGRLSEDYFKKYCRQLWSI